MGEFVRITVPYLEAQLKLQIGITWYSKCFKTPKIGNYP